VRDEELESNLATVAITVNPVNDAPIIVGGLTVVATEDEPAVIDPLAFASDIDGDNLLFTLNAPAHGTLTPNADGTYSYTPNADFHGTDSFSFSVSDGTTTVNGSVTVLVEAVNDAPVASDATVSILEDTALGIDLRSFASDVDSPVLIPTVVAGPLHGTLSTNADGTYSYTPNANFFGTDSFTYRVRDEELDSNTATVTINVASVNDAPTGTDGMVTTLEDVPYIFQLADFGFSDGSDTPANNFLAVTIDTVPAVGSLTLNGTALVGGETVATAEIAAGLLVYAPAPNANGNAYAAFSFRVQPA